MQMFVHILIELVEKYTFKTEVIIVDWNPPADRPHLRDALHLKRDLKSTKVRFIEVPNEIHLKIPHSDKVPLFQYIAKNVGIRRAKGEYIFATNADLLFNEELIKFLSSKSLSKECFYRIDRCDVKKKIPIKLSLQDQLKFCEKNIFRINTRYGSFSRDMFLMEALFPYMKRITFLTYHFIKIMKRMILSYKRRSNIKTEGEFDQLDYTETTVLSINSIIKFFLSNIRPRRRTVILSKEQVRSYANELHTNASGDFFLMAREHWYALKGYPERFKTQYYVDGYLCYMAYGIGLQQRVLKRPMRIYHQEHDRSEHESQPKPSYQEYQEFKRSIMKFRQPIIFNNDEWGLGKYHILEYHIS